MEVRTSPFSKPIISSASRWITSPSVTPTVSSSIRNSPCPASTLRYNSFPGWLWDFIFCPGVKFNMNIELFLLLKTSILVNRSSLKVRADPTVLFLMVIPPLNESFHLGERLFTFEYTRDVIHTQLHHIIPRSDRCAADMRKERHIFHADERMIL